MLVKIHKKDHRTIIAVCDRDLIGKKFEENNQQLDLTGEFYNGEHVDADEIGDLLRNADGVNLVGEKSVGLGIQEEVIEEKNIIRVKNIPYAQASIVQS